jgi:hypothetical protein
MRWAVAVNDGNGELDGVDIKLYRSEIHRPTEAGGNFRKDTA